MAERPSGRHPVRPVLGRPVLGRTVQVRTVQVQRAGASTQDVVAVEAPLEIRLGGRPLAVTLRTPGHDVELGLGFLLAEGIVEELGDVERWQLEEQELGGVLDVELIPQALDRWARRKVEREFRTNSACGACGKPRLQDLFVEPRAAAGQGGNAKKIAENSVESNGLDHVDFGAWIASARDQQTVFEQTGGVHAAAAFDRGGVCRAVFEDVGRHNAVDKLVGHALIEERSSGKILDGWTVLSTGRAGFEIVQKSLRARATALVTIGAATSMAVDLAIEGGLPLVAFSGSQNPVVF